MAKTVSNKGWWTALAAAAVVGLLVAGWRWRDGAALDRETVLLTAARHASAGANEAVVDLLSTYLSSSPADEQAVVLLAQAYSNLEKPEEGLSYWLQVPETSVYYAQSLLEAGKAYFHLRKARSAEASLRQCLDAARRTGNVRIQRDAFRELTRLYWVQRRKADLRLLLHQWSEHCFESGDLAAQQEPAVWMLRVHLKLMPTQEGLEWTEAFVANDAADGASRQALGEYLAEAGEVDRALAHLDLCLDRDAVLAPTLESWLSHHLQAGRSDRVAGILDWLGDRAGPASPLSVCRAQWLFDAGDVDGAVQTLQSRLETSPYDREALSHLVRWLARQRDPVGIEEAKAALETLNQTIEQLQGDFLRLQQGSLPDGAECRRIADRCLALGWIEAGWGWLRRSLAAGEASHPFHEQLRTLRPDLDRWVAEASNPKVFQSIPTPANGQSAEERSLLTTDLRFVDVTGSAGVHFEYDRGETGRYWIVEANGGGCAWLDADLDGALDLYFVNGRSLTGKDRNSWSTNQFYRNVDGLRFVEETVPALLGDRGYGQGCAVGDFDGDGFPDLYVTNYGPNVLYRNCGDGTFEVCDMEATRGVGFSTGATFADVNGDGVLDLYVAGYLEFDEAKHGVPCRHAGTQSAEYCGPRCCPPAPDRLLLGDPAFNFKDVSERSGVGGVPARPGFAVVAADFNQDERTDFYVANDGQANFLFLNQGDDGDGVPMFQEVGLERGCALSDAGAAQGSMGVAVGDFDNDADLDLGVTNYFYEHFTLYRNDGGYFTDASIPSCLAGATRTSMGWGTALVDFDNDGWGDIYMTNGHINPGDGSTPYAMQPQLFQNRRDGSFLEATTRAGDFFQRTFLGRGAAFADFDNDGRPDLVQVSHHAPSTLVRNVTETSHRWLSVRLVGRRSNRDGFNAKLTLTLFEDGRSVTRFREHSPNGSFLSSNDPRVHFGLGTAEVQKLQIRWPSGTVQRIASPPIGQELLIVEPLEP